ncbi:phage shock protein PspD [Serratia sp. UGAL515B_01]|uniref:phage shock protein PspD n=1 Tax=Serratia sp. UGAL515B_01 TaxID=2986763 RepID=UPI0029541AB7|nr:phage shock protein PspD [Serratia sp. UGAL515B_01]WON78679.1 phage shock protein D [Serratia sp. UGAL515B_01]
MTKSSAFKQGAGKVLKKLPNVIIIALMSYGPTRATSWLLKAVSRKPLRFVLAMLLEPLFRKGLGRVFGRYAKESNEKTEK